MDIILCDFESVFTPEVWIGVAKKTGIKELEITTKDEPDYDKLMKRRIEILKENKITLKDIQDVIREMPLLEGAKEFMDWLKSKAPTIILSDTFKEFARPFLEKLDFPALLCHNLTTDEEGFITGYNLRIDDSKRHAVQAFKKINYRTIAFGDSYNDTNMLKEADVGILFCPPENVIKEFPQFPITKNYEELKDLIKKSLKTK
jgi:phosphoserine/homoserine phosphotransferase